MTNNNGVLSRPYTDFVRFVLCVLIFVHHYYCATSYNKYTEWLGYFACALFFFLSVNGVVSSQKSKQLDLFSFMKRRFLKVWLPVVFVTIVFTLFVAVLLKRQWGITYYPPGMKFCFSPHSDALTTLLYFVDIKKVDSVTWFIHYLIITYFLIWVYARIAHRGLRLLVVLIVFLVAEALFFYHGFYKMYKIDVIGILMGFVYAEFKDTSDRLIFASGRHLSTCMAFFFILTVISAEMIRPFHTFISVLLSMLYCIVGIVLMIRMSMIVKITNERIASLLGGVSMYVYLIHNKVISLSDRMDIALCFIVVFISSLAFYYLFNPLIKKCI
jgi:peptidoglycan/LPS O-acetylase OafA/YrhL